jgi:O-antigen ligase
VQIAKHKLVNALFLLGFPCYGIGSYVSIKQNYSAGIVFGVTPFLAILLFHVIDLLYKGRITVQVNRWFWVGMAYLTAVAAGYFVALHNGYKGLNPVNVSAQALAVLVPFPATVVVLIYNRANAAFNWAHMLLTGIGALILKNLVAYGAGIRSVGHGFEGRINLPFIGGIYDGAHMYAVIALMLLFHLGGFMQRPVRASLFMGGFLLSMALIANANSRLSIMILFVLLALFVTQAMRRVKGLYTISIFTMPLLMSFTLLVFEVLSLPVFSAILGRVDKADVTTFNGRTYIWEAAWDWLFDDRRGLLLGNGYMGQAHIGLLDFMERLWEGEARLIHMHSTFLEVLIDQGLLVLGLMYLLMYKGYTHYRQAYLAGAPEAPLFGAMVYLLFIWQIDIFCYGIDIGAPLLFAVFAGFCVDRGQAAVQATT